MMEMSLQKTDEKKELNIKVNKECGKLKLALSGRFDFKSNSQFRKTCEAGLNETGAGDIELDLGNVDYMDSSALGMLLRLKERAEAANCTTTLVNCHGTVRQILDVVNFEKLFTIK